MIGDMPNDIHAIRRSIQFVKTVFGKGVYAYLMEKAYKQCFDQKVYGLEPGYRAYNQNPTLICDDLQHRLISGQVALKPQIKSFGKNSVKFDDGTEEEVDDVIFCTGFSYEFKYVENGKLIPTDEGQLRLWKNMIPLELVGESEKPCTLGIVGMLQVRLYYYNKNILCKFCA